MKHRTPRSRSDRLFSLFVGFVIASVVADIWDEVRDEGARDEVQRVLMVIEEQTSPEAQARQQDEVQGLILLIDCNTRYAFQEALDALDDSVLEPGAVVVTENCPTDG